MMAEFLFVYGTLKKGAKENKHAFIEPHTEFFSYATAPGELYRYEDAEFIYPGYEYDEDKPFQVRGELYVITNAEALFLILDEYEGCTVNDPKPHQYTRQKVTVKSNVAFEYQAWTYTYNWPTKGLQRIESGNFI